MIKDVAFIAYAVRDVSRSVAFYQDGLGLQTGLNFEVEDILAARRQRIRIASKKQRAACPST